MYICRRPRRLNIEPNWYRRVRHLAISADVCEPYVIAWPLHLNAVSVVPVELNVLDFDITQAIDIDKRLSAQNNRRHRSISADRIPSRRVLVQILARAVVKPIAI